MLFDGEIQVIWEVETQGLRFSVGFVKHMKEKRRVCSSYRLGAIREAEQMT